MFSTPGVESFGDGMLDVLENNPPRYLGIFLLELLTLVPDTATDIHIDRFVLVIRISPLQFARNREYRQPGNLWLTTERHVIVEVVEVPWILTKPL